jgi:hypothetical protein
MQQVRAGKLTSGIGDLISDRNHSSATSVSLLTGVGGSQSNANASIVVKKLN